MSRLIRKDKPTVCLDFDGIFNNYKGYDGDNLGTPRQGLREFLETLSQEYSITIFSVRPHVKIIPWLESHGLLCYISNVTSYKPVALAYIDDRAITFNGDYAATLKELKNFKPYWRNDL